MALQLEDFARVSISSLTLLGLLELAWLSIGHLSIAGACVALHRSRRHRLTIIIIIIIIIIITYH